MTDVDMDAAGPVASIPQPSAEYRNHTEPVNPGGEASNCPLVVDLDGTLVRSDLLAESAFAMLAANPLRLACHLMLIGRGKAALKAAIAADTPIDVAHLPYDDRVVALIDEARREGRKVFIASASNERYVAAIAAHVGADGWFASNDSENLSSRAKAKRLVEVFGEKSFDYIGDGRADLPVWAVARAGIAVEPSASVRRELASAGSNVRVLEPAGNVLRAWIREFRLHQWAKNALVFVPVLTSHRFDVATILAAIGAFLAFSLTASAVYIVNDLADLDADRKHPTKKNRPLAAGTIPILTTVPVAIGLLIVACGIALAINPRFAAVLFGYFVLTTAYTFHFKRKMLLDVVVLATLYTLRVVGGMAAISVDVSEWLLAFSMFVFASLALVKRYIELATRLDADLPDPSNRNYRKSDLGVIMALAAATGFNAVTVFALYISSDTVRQLYRHPQVLWFVCPTLLYWLGRTLMLADRRLMDDDPILFALKDRTSLVAFALIAIVMIAAI